MMHNSPYNVYVLKDSKDRIVSIDGGCSENNITGNPDWILIDSGEGKKYEYCQTQYFNKPLYDERGIRRYKLVDGKPVERTQEEMDADWVEPVPQPSDAERIAQLEEELKAAKILLGLEV